MKKALFIFLICVHANIGKTQTIHTDNQLKTNIDTAVHIAIIPFMNEASRVGLSIGIYKNGKVYTYNYGSLQKGKQTLPVKSTIFEIGSITKTFTGILLAQAVYDKKVSLEDDIRKYLEGNYPNLEYKGHPITLFHLVNHCSGLPYFLPNKPEILNTQNYDSLISNIEKSQQHYSKKDFFEDLHKVQLDTIPGFKSRYSNSAVQLLGFILERVYKMPYDKLLQKYITIPLHMNSTSLTYLKLNDTNLAKGYNSKGELMSYMPELVGAAGGISSSVNDMLNYIQFHLNENNKLVALSHKITWGNLDDYAIGMYWDENKTSGGYRRLLHSGGTFGFSSYCVIYPDRNTGIVLLSNEADQNTQGTLEEAANKLFEALDKTPGR